MVKNKISRKTSIKKYIFIAIPLSVICLAVVGLKVLGSRGDDWQLQVSDVSKNCYSNVLNIYSDKDYVVLSAIGSKVIAKGKSNYPKSIDFLENEIKNYKPDKESLMNYKIKSKSDTEIYADQYNSPELAEFIKTIKVENLFWCE